ncbi:zinc finger protein 576, tandem duplicate 2 [Silurus asotus]|uniref:Zinc finger protein 576, tandem duplicate 2 n=1 Tax=Silurus asotus TaxID=30991 RepID=A0AAD5FLW3_SILAS|nr:zinc finger protein 576, tandem duplicate 2 [Silurus asotus]
MEIAKEDVGARKSIPPKKDRMEPLKMDMSKSTVIPLTSSQLSLQCLECHIIFSDDKSKQRHLKMNHPTEYEQCMLGDSLFACYVCDQHFTCSTELMAHQRSHTEKQPFKCPICGESFSRSTKLTSHKKVHYNKQGYTCSDCGKLYKTFTLLKYHQRIHTGEKPYVCLHKDCGKRFIMPKALQRHLEAHQKDEIGGVDCLTNTSYKAKKRRSKGTSTRKYECSQCNESFKTAKSQLHHNKIKHLQCSFVKPSSAVATGSPSLTDVVQLPLPHIEAIGPTVQQISPLGVEQIKRLIEKMGNVQKVNQLVIFGLDQVPFQAENAGNQHPQGLIQQLHFDFTQPTDQEVVLQPAEDRIGHEETASTGTEQDTLLDSTRIEVADEQKKTVEKNVVQATICAECPEKQVSVTESDLTGAQLNGIQYELLPELTEKDFLPPELEASHKLMLTTDMLQIQNAMDVKSPESLNNPSLAFITEFESRMASEKEFDINPTDITVSEKINTNAEPCQKDSEVADLLMEPMTQTVEGNVDNSDMTSADPPSQQPSAAIGFLVEPEPQTEQEAPDKLDETNADTESQCQKMMEATDSFVEPQPKIEQVNPKLDQSQAIEDKLDQQHLKKIFSSEDLMIKPSLLKPPNQESSISEEVPCSESSAQHSGVETNDQNPLAEDSPYVKKVLPAKKKRSKKQLKKQSQYSEPQDDATKGTLPITKNQKIVSKSPKKQEKTKKHFGNKQNKKKNSKSKLLNISKNSLYKDQEDIDLGNVPVVSHTEKGKLKHKHKKGRKAERSAGLIQALSLPCEQKLMKVPEQAHRGKPRKRKFENQRELVKKGRSVQESQQDENPVPKKKKSGKIPETVTQKKAKSNVKVNKVNRKSHKLAKQREKDKDVSDTPVIDQIKEQALLLLKGHKQPQLKVHKLDAKTTGLDHQLIQNCQSNEIYGYETTVEPAKEGLQSKSPSQKKKKTKTMGRKSKVDSKQASHLQTSPINSDLLTPGAKQKVARKRKATAKIDQEIALSPPYSHLIIGCHDCGQSFSEVSALQEHMASMHSGHGALLSTVPCDASEIPNVSLRPNEMMLTNTVLSSGLEMRVPTDWDVELEMRDIGLGDEQRNEHRLSFPALNPSPSFQMTTPFVEVEGKQDEAKNHEAPVRLKKAVRKKSETNKTKLKVQENMGVPLLLPASLSEPEKIVDGHLVTVEAQNEGDSHVSTKVPILSQNNSHKVSDAQEVEASHTTFGHIPSFTSNQLSPNPVNAASTSNPGSYFERSEIKQEADELLVQTVASQTNTSMTRGRRGRGSKGRGRRQLGKRRSAENKHPEELVASEKDCQVVFELYSLTGTSEEKNEEIIQKDTSINATASSPRSASTESSEVQEVCMLPQPVTASASETKSKNGSLRQKSGEHDKNCSLSTSLRKRRISVQCQSGMTGQSDHGLTSAGTSADVKMEASPSVLTPHDVSVNDGDFLQGVQMILVKAEDQQISNDPHVLQEAQHIQMNHNACQVGISSGSPTVTQSSTAKQCIFYPVKEEEGEMLVEPQANNQETTGSEGSEERTEPWGTAGLEECQIRIGCTQMEVHHNIYSGTEECTADAEQPRSEDILEFLSQTSDREDYEGVHSEPEAETHILSCYCGIYANGAVRPCEIANAEQHANISKNTDCPEAEDQQTGSKEHCEPIDYFIQYFSWNIWKDIAVCTGQVSKLAKPVTKEEVAHFVGIHIAMGTLKFPSMKLYWDDFTRVPLIADAMSAAMFSELASNLRLASLEEDGLNQNGQNAHEDQGTRNCNKVLVSKKDPLWKVQAIVNRVREGCQALQRNGNYGVDQYPLPFQKHPTHSLHHTVVINAAGLVVDFSLRVNDCNREEIVKRMVAREKSDQQGMVFLCKPELSTPSMLEHLLEAGVRSAGKVGGARGQIGPHFRMDSDILKIEEIVMGGGETAAPADVSPEKEGKPYTTIIIQDPPVPPVIQSYQHESLQCFQCFITFCNSKAKERHMKKSHREEYKQQLQQCDTLFTCYVCDRTFPSSEELTLHQSTHNKEDKPFKCAHCRESFRTFSELTTHRRQVCPERQFACKECNETFRSPALLRTHRVAQHPARPDGDDTDDPSKTHRCGKCGRGFEEESELLQHQENHASNQHCNGGGPVKRRGRPPKAETSSAGGEKKQKLSENEAAEKPEDTPPAPVAAEPPPAEAKPKAGGRRGRPPKSGSQDPKPDEDKSDSKKTKAASPTARQIPCPECDLVFSAPAQLRAHKKEKHTQRKANPCQECEESFNRAAQLEAHMARAHKAGRYSCSTCGKSFGRESNLKAHQQSHEKEDEKSSGGGKR